MINRLRPLLIAFLLSTTFGTLSLVSANDACPMPYTISQYATDGSALAPMFLCEDYPNGHVVTLGISFCLDEVKCANNDPRGWGWLSEEDMTRLRYQNTQYILGRDGLIPWDGANKVKFFLSLFFFHVSVASTNGIPTNQSMEGFKTITDVSYYPPGQAHEILLSLYKAKTKSTDQVRVTEAKKKLSKRIVTQKKPDTLLPNKSNIDFDHSSHQ